MEEAWKSTLTKSKY